MIHDLAAVYGGLFLSAFLAATLLPAQSEIVLAGLAADGSYSMPALIGVATLGNVLGACVNWWLGRTAARLKPLAHTRAVSWYRRFGIWSLLFSWLPVVGDPLTLAAGVLGVSFLPFLVLVTVGKAARYLLLGGLFG